MYHEDVGRTARINATEHDLKIALTAKSTHERLSRYINSKCSEPSVFAHKEDALQTLNIIMANHPNRQDDIFQSGQNKFFRYPDAESYPKLDFQGGLIGVRGYYSSVRTSTSRILLNLNAQCSPFYKAINLASLMLEVLEHVTGRGKDESAT